MVIIIFNKHIYQIIVLKLKYCIINYISIKLGGKRGKNK